MGQKSNLLTVRRNLINLSLNEINTKVYLNLFKLLENLTNSFLVKGAYTFQSTINITSNQCFLNFKLFYKTLKINLYRKRKFRRRRLKYRRVNKKERLLLLLSPYFNLLRVNTFIFSFYNFNKFVNKKFVLFIYKKTNKFIKQVFSRQFGLYIDFLKVTSLLLQNLVGPKVFLDMISSIFKNIDKSKHSRFFSFLRNLFTLLISIHRPLKKNIKGIKFVIRGRLQGKPRASTRIILLGSVPAQTFKKEIDYVLTHTYTKLGAFGMKLWMHRSA
jgi:hypothetical protein